MKQIDGGFLVEGPLLLIVQVAVAQLIYGCVGHLIAPDDIHHRSKDGVDQGGLQLHISVEDDGDWAVGHGVQIVEKVLGDGNHCRCALIQSLGVAGFLLQNGHIGEQLDALHLGDEGTGHDGIVLIPYRNGKRLHITLSGEIAQPDPEGRQQQKGQQQSGYTGAAEKQLQVFT